MIKAYRRTSFRYDFIRENHEKEINFSFKFVSQEGKDKKKPHFKGLNLHFEFFNIKNLAIVDKKKQLQKTYGILMEKEMDKEVMDMCNFSDFIEQRGIEKGLEQGLEQGLVKGLEQGLQQGKAEGKIEGKAEATLLHVKKLMQRINVSAVEAMNILDVEDDIRPAVLQSLHLS